MQHHYYGQFQPDGETSTDELRFNESTNDSTAYDAGSMSNEPSHAPFQQQFLASHEDGTSANTSNLTNWANDVADRRDAMSEMHRAAYDDEIRHMQFDFTDSSNSNNMEAAQERQMYPSRDSHETVLTSQELSDGIAAILSGGSFHFGPSNLSGATSLSGRHASSLPEIQPSYGGQGTLPNLAKTSPSLRSQTSSFHSDPTSLRAPIEAESSGSHSQAGTLDRRCSTCGIRDSPEWRKGFDGNKTLCNACGLRHSRNVNRARRKEEMGRIAGEVAANGGVVPEHLRMNKLADDFRRRKRSKSASSSAASNLQQSFTSFDVSSPEVQRSLEPISLFSFDANSAGDQSSFQPPAQRPQTSNPSDVRSPQGSNN